MTYQQEIFNLITAFSGQANTIAVPRLLCQFAGSLEGGTLLSQMLYWSDRGEDPDGWFFKSYVEWADEVFLTEYQVRKLTKQFEEAGILETKLKKANGSPTLHYRIKMAEFSESILKFLRNQDSLKFKNPSLKNEETLTKTTTKTTTISRVAPAAPSVGGEEVRNEKRPKPEKPPPETPEETAILDAFTAAKARHEPGGVVDRARARPPARALVAAGWHPDQITEFFDQLKQEPYWFEKVLSLKTLSEQIGAKYARTSRNSGQDHDGHSGGDLQQSARLLAECLISAALVNGDIDEAEYERRFAELDAATAVPDV